MVPVSIRFGLLAALSHGLARPRQDEALPSNRVPALDNTTLWAELNTLPWQHEIEQGRQCAPGPLTELVLEGGGVRGIAYAGAVCALEETGVLDGLEIFAGSSAGAIAAALLASGYGCADLRAALWSVDFAQLVRSNGGWLGSVERLVSDFGLFDGKQLEHVVESLLYAKTGLRHMTFRQLKGRGGLLRVTASSLTTSRSVVFSADDTPNVVVSRAVRASAAIPVLFTPVEIDGHLYVDGGLLRNLPVQHPQRGTPDSGSADRAGHATMAFSLRSQRLLGNPHPEALATLPSFLSRLYWTVVWGPDSSNSLLRAVQHPSVEYVPVEFGALGIGPRDFTLTIDQKQQLEHAGWTTTSRQLLRCGRIQWPKV